MWNQLWRSVSVLGGREVLGSSDETPGPVLAEAKTMATARKSFGGGGVGNSIGAKGNTGKTNGCYLGQRESVGARGGRK